MDNNDQIKQCKNCEFFNPNLDYCNKKGEGGIPEYFDGCNEFQLKKSINLKLRSL